MPRPFRDHPAKPAWKRRSPQPQPLPDREPRDPKKPRPPGDSSWQKSADWYDRIIGAQGSEVYQTIVIPASLDLLAPQKNQKVLDLGCGQGVFARALANHGCDVTGLDSAPALIKKAQSYPSRRPIQYVARDAEHLHGLGPFDAVASILALQNMPHLDKVCAASAAVLREGGRMLWVLNHPCYRIPRQTAWGWDEERKIQFRRVDAYASSMDIPIVMHPGQAKSESTTSFHHNLTDLMSFAFAAGFSLIGFDEWISDKKSEPGPRGKAENRAREEFPLFMAMLWQKSPVVSK